MWGRTDRETPKSQPILRPARRADLLCVKTTLGAPGDDGRRRPVAVEEERMATPNVIIHHYLGGAAGPFHRAGRSVKRQEATEFLNEAIPAYRVCEW